MSLNGAGTNRAGAPPAFSEDRELHFDLESDIWIWSNEIGELKSLGAD
jgi:hypothetical protein